METNFEKGYDSDGESPPLADAEDVQEVNEEDNVPETPPAPMITPNSADSRTFVDISLTEIKKLKVAELKSELQKRGPDTKGLKGASLGRVTDAITNRVNEIHYCYLMECH
jgi:hypothetical protein